MYSFSTTDNMPHSVQTTVYDSVYHTPGGVYQARLLDNQEGANTERYVFRRLLAKRFPNADLFSHRHYYNCRHVEHGKSAQPSVLHPAAYDSYLSHPG